jgi:hypothetical protein
MGWLGVVSSQVDAQVDALDGLPLAGVGWEILHDLEIS